MYKIKEFFSDINKLDLKIMKTGLSFCLVLLILSVLILSYNLIFTHTITIYNLGTTLLKISLYISVEFIICGIIIDKIYKELT